MIPKFRAYWEHTHQTQEVTEINYKGNWVCDEPYVVVDGRCDLIPLRECILMQSTGLKDKNCVEIFEGDVVKMDRPPVNEKSLFLVKDYVLGKVIFAEVNEFGKDSWSFNGGYTGYSLEVIGNIYENPELLEGEKR